MSATPTNLENILPDLVRAKRLNNNEPYSSLAKKHQSEAIRVDPVSTAWIVKVARGKDKSPDGLREYLELYITQTKERFGEAFYL